MAANTSGNTLVGDESDHESSSTPPYKCWNRGLDELLQDLEGSRLFRDFLDKEESFVEIYDFWFAVAGLQNIQDTEIIQKLIRRIFKKYILHEVNADRMGVSPETRRELCDSFSPSCTRPILDISIFNNARTEVCRTLTRYHSMFIGSYTYLEYISQVSQPSRSDVNSSSDAFSVAQMDNSSNPAASYSEDDALGTNGCRPFSILPTLHEDSELIPQTPHSIISAGSGARPKTIQSSSVGDPRLFINQNVSYPSDLRRMHNSKPPTVDNNVPFSTISTNPLAAPVRHSTARSSSPLAPLGPRVHRGFSAPPLLAAADELSPRFNEQMAESYFESQRTGHVPHPYHPPKPYNSYQFTSAQDSEISTEVSTRVSEISRQSKDSHGQNRNRSSSSSSGGSTIRQTHNNSSATGSNTNPHIHRSSSSHARKTINENVPAPMADFLSKPPQKQPNHHNLDPQQFMDLLIPRLQKVAEKQAKEEKSDQDLQFRLRLLDKQRREMETNEIDSQQVNNGMSSHCQPGQPADVVKRGLLATSNRPLTARDYVKIMSRCVPFDSSINDSDQSILDQHLSRVGSQSVDWAITPPSHLRSPGTPPTHLAHSSSHSSHRHKNAIATHGASKMGSFNGMPPPSVNPKKSGSHSNPMAQSMKSRKSAGSGSENFSEELHNRLNSMQLNGQPVPNGTHYTQNSTHAVNHPFQMQNQIHALQTQSNGNPSNRHMVHNQHFNNQATNNHNKIHGNSVSHSNGISYNTLPRHPHPYPAQHPLTVPQHGNVSNGYAPNAFPSSVTNPKLPSNGHANNNMVTVFYYFDDEQLPYSVRIPSHSANFKNFRDHVNIPPFPSKSKKSSSKAVYKYWFEEETGYDHPPRTKAEYHLGMDDDKVLPIISGKVTCWIIRISVDDSG